MEKVTPETELRAMIGDLFMQLAMARAELANRPPAPAAPQANGPANGKEMPDADYRAEPG